MTICYPLLTSDDPPKCIAIWLPQREYTMPNHIYKCIYIHVCVCVFVNQKMMAQGRRQYHRYSYQGDLCIALEWRRVGWGDQVDGWNLLVLSFYVLATFKVFIDRWVITQSRGQYRRYSNQSKEIYVLHLNGVRGDGWSYWWLRPIVVVLLGPSNI